MSAIIGTHSDKSIGSHPLVSRLLRGIEAIQPKLPRYSNTWNVTTLLKALKSIPLNIKWLTLKTVTLVALTTASPCSELAKLKVNLISFQNDTTICQIDGSKTWRKKEMKQINLSSFPEDPALCPIQTLKGYLAETKSLRPPKESKLFIGNTKPLNHVTASTISRWIKSTLEMAGINTNQFKAYSTRSACTSTAASAAIPIDTILQLQIGKVQIHSVNYT